MPKPKSPRARKSKRLSGQRINIWIPAHHLKLWRSIENRSKFVQLCLDDAPGIMAWAIMRERDKRYTNDKHKLEDVLEPFNDTFPLDPATQARIDKQEKEKCDNSQPKPELW